jgi:hypothetical protein
VHAWQGRDGAPEPHLQVMIDLLDMHEHAQPHSGSMPASRCGRVALSQMGANGLPRTGA